MSKSVLFCWLQPNNSFKQSPHRGFSREPALR